MKIRFLLLQAIVCYILLDTIVVPLPQVQAHPHVFVVQRLTVVFDDKGLAGIRVRWKFDDMFASMIAADHDRNRNGSFEPEEVAVVKAKAFAFIAEFNYFNFIKIDRRPFPVKFIKGFNAVLKDGKLAYEFFIPCHVTATGQLKKVRIATYDPSYYTAIFFARNKPATLTAAEAFEVKTAIREDPDTKIYFDMVHPWTLFLEFRKKS